MGGSFFKKYFLADRGFEPDTFGLRRVVSYQKTTLHFCDKRPDWGCSYSTRKVKTITNWGLGGGHCKCRRSHPCGHRGIPGHVLKRRFAA